MLKFLEYSYTFKNVFTYNSTVIRMSNGYNILKMHKLFLGYIRYIWANDRQLGYTTDSSGTQMLY